MLENLVGVTEPYDLLISFELFEHLHDPLIFIKNCKNGHFKARNGVRIKPGKKWAGLGWHPRSMCSSTARPGAGAWRVFCSVSRCSACR